MPVASRITPAQAEEISRRQYGIDGTATRLDAEIDDAFRLDAANGTPHLLKISVTGTSTDLDATAGRGEASFQTALLLHLAATAPELPVQRIVPAPDGRPEITLVVGGAARLARMTSWLDGTPLGTAPSRPALRRDIGATLARLNTALRGFRHPGADRTHRWDMQNFGQLRPLLDELGEIEERAALLDCLDRFDTVVRPRIAAARRQVVHTDFHGDNLLTDGTRVTGILDFGDALTGPVAMDVGVAACYQLGADRDTADPLPPALDVAAGYHAADPLTPADLALGGEFIQLRLAARIIVSQWNAARDPANSGYLLRITPRAAQLFGLLRAIPPEDIHDRLRAALENAS
jgi:Ser/Thr protein kinase RdoA (MazF antagonist)